jgi:hypothetical protein
MEDRARARIRGFARIYAAYPTATARVQHCTQKAQAIAEVRLLDLSIATGRLNPNAFSKAIADYVVLRNSTPQAPHVKGAVPTDLALGVFARAPALSLHAALPAKDEGWIVLLSPKATGWDQAAVTLKTTPGGALTVQSATILSF